MSKVESRVIISDDRPTDLAAKVPHSKIYVV